MSNNLKEILVIDIECTRDPRSITEIGLARLVPATGEIIRGEELYCFNRDGDVGIDYWGIIDYSTKHLRYFDHALEILKDTYKSQRYTWASWGDFDKRMFESQCSDMGLEYPFSANHLNVKLLFSFNQGLNRGVGMKYALDRIGMSLEGTHHSGIDDAYNTAKILRHILMSEG